MTRDNLTIWITVVISALVALASFRFVFLGFELAFPNFGPHLDSRWWSFASHVGAAPIALILGALQFVHTIRHQWPVLHRWLGRSYVLAVLIGGIGGLNLAFNALGGPVAAAGFGLLAVLWILFTLYGMQLARSQRFVEHRRWMIRSFALTMAAVTLRIYLVVFLAAGIDYVPASVFLGWICWVPNLLVAQWWLTRSASTARPRQ